MRFKGLLLFGCAALFAVACSNTVDCSSEEDDDVELSSSSQKSGKSSSSVNGMPGSSVEDDEKSSGSVAVDEEEDDCAGEPGRPWDGTTAKEFACGAGTKLKPYMIMTAEQLAHLSFVIGAKDANYLEKHYKLGADIILNEGKIIDDKGALVADSTKLHKWTPIGNSNVAFAGNFDGNGHVVSGMFINTTSTHNGLLGNVSGTVLNLTVENSWVKGGKYTAGVIGYSIGTTNDLENEASVTGADDCAGGVVGKLYRVSYQNAVVAKRLYNKGIVTGKNNVGGVAGCATHVLIETAVNYADVSGFGYVGGVIGGIGATNDNDVSYLKNTGKVEGVHFVGGTVGHCGGNPSIPTYSNSSSYSCADYYPCGRIVYAYNEGDVAGKRYVGGVLGISCTGKLSDFGNVADVEGEYGVGGVVGSQVYTTTNFFYNVGDVSGKEYVGGIFSYNKEGINSSAYSTGKVDGDTLVGLMIGSNYNSTIADFYYLTQGEQKPFGRNDGGGVATPKSADEIKTKEFAELLGNDFVYASELNDGFPVLTWEAK